MLEYKRLKKGSFLKISFLVIFATLLVVAVSISGCCISLPLKAYSSAVSASIEEAEGGSLSGDTSEENNAADETSEVTESTQQKKTEDITAQTSAETSAETEEETVAYNNDFTLYDLNKNRVSMHDYKGKIVVLNFWATWCPPCVAEVPDFVETYNEYKDKNVQFFGISDDDINALANFVAEYNVTYPTLIDGSEDRIMPAWGIDAIPHTFILNGNGDIVFDNLGMMSKDQLVNAIENALSQQ